MSSNEHNEAQQAFERLRPQLSPRSAALIEQRLAGWQRPASPRPHLIPSAPALVLRPGLPPRPLSKHYFTIVHRYE